MKDKYIVYFISKTKKKMMSFIENKLKETEINDLVPAYGNILTVLYNNNGQLNMKQIGDLIGKDKSTITALVNKLIKLGYVIKEKSQIDRRITYVKLTDKGWKAEPVFNDISSQVYERAYFNFTDEEKETLLRLLKKLNNNFD